MASPHPCPSVSAVCAAIDKPVSVIGSMASGTVTVAQLIEAGVMRISPEVSFFRTREAGLRGAAQEILARGTFTNAS